MSNRFPKYWPPCIYTLHISVCISVLLSFLHLQDAYLSYLNQKRFLVKRFMDPLLDIHCEKTTILKDTCVLMFPAAWFTTCRTWKWPRCPSTKEYIKKMWCIYAMEYYSTIKKNKLESVPVRWMNLELVKVRKWKPNIVY